MLVAVVLISLDCEPKLTMTIGFAITMEFYVSVQLTYNSFAIRCSPTLAPSYSLLSTAVFCDFRILWSGKAMI